MSDSKIQIKVGIVEFSGEGNQDWLATQLDKILEKVPELLRIELSTNGTGGEGEGQKNGSPNGSYNDMSSKNLASWLKEKDATTNQVKKFLATATFLQLKGKNRLTTTEVTSALRNANQSKLNNASDCLGQNVKKGFCEKEGKEFFVTSNGLQELGVEL